MNYNELFINLFKMIVSGGITFAICFGSAILFDKFELPRGIFELTKIVTLAVECLIVYTALNLALKMDYARELADRVLSRVKKQNIEN